MKKKESQVVMRTGLTWHYAGKQSVHYKGIVLDVETKVDENEHENACGYCLLCCMMYELCIYIYIYTLFIHANADWNHTIKVPNGGLGYEDPPKGAYTS